MKATTSELRTHDVIGPNLDACEEGLDFLAHAIREDIVHCRKAGPQELEESKRIGAKLVLNAVVWLRRMSTAPNLPLPATLMDALLGCIQPFTSRRELMETFQEAADLIRAVRLEAEEARVGDPAATLFRGHSQSASLHGRQS